MSTTIIGETAVSNRRPNEVKFFYLHDTETPGRVLTVARKLGKNGRKIHYAIAVCKPSVWLSPFVMNRGDEFRKEIGRTITEGRLAKKPYKVAAVKDESPLITVMRDISTHESDAEVPQFIKALATRWLKAKFSKTSLVVDGVHHHDLDLCEKCQGKVEKYVSRKRAAYPSNKA